MEEKVKKEPIRHRRPNFSATELNIITDELLEDPELGRGELGGKYKTPLDLKKRWNEIAEKLNACELMSRSGDEVKNKFSDLKTKTKKKASEIRKYREATGGGAPIKTTLTDLEEKVLEIIGAIVTDGLPGSIDSFNLNRNNNQTTSAFSKVTNEDIQPYLVCSEIPATPARASTFEAPAVTDNMVIRLSEKAGTSNVKSSSTTKRKKQVRKRKRRQGAIATNILKNQENILREMKKTNFFLQKLVNLKKEEITFLVNSNSITL